MTGDSIGDSMGESIGDKSFFGGSEANGVSIAPANGGGGLASPRSRLSSSPRLCESISPSISLETSLSRLGYPGEYREGEMREGDMREGEPREGEP